jgi:hypothetical protein
MNAIVKSDRQNVALGYDDIERLAASIAKSGLFGIKTTDQAVALMMIAHAEGRHPALAARDYDIIQGRPAKKADAMLRDFLDGGGKVEWHSLTDATADATFSHPAGGTARISWDMKRAATAGLANKDNYKKFPRQMLRSRTVSEGVRTVWPLATSGMYVPEEANDIQPQFSGPTIDHEPAQPPERQTAPAAKPARTRGQFLDDLERDLLNAQIAANAADEVDKIVCGADVMRAKTEFRNGHLERLNRIIFDALQAVTPQSPENDPDGGPVIAGEEFVGAG